MVALSTVAFHMFSITDFCLRSVIWFRFLSQLCRIGISFHMHSYFRSFQFRSQLIVLNHYWRFLCFFWLLPGLQTDFVVQWLVFLLHIKRSYFEPGCISRPSFMLLINPSTQHLLDISVQLLIWGACFSACCSIVKMLVLLAQNQ